MGGRLPEPMRVKREPAKAAWSLMREVQKRGFVELSETLRLAFFPFFSPVYFVIRCVKKYLNYI